MFCPFVPDLECFFLFFSLFFFFFFFSLFFSFIFSKKKNEGKSDRSVLRF